MTTKESKLNFAPMIVHYIGFTLIIISFIGIFFGIVGMLRFSDFFSQQHAAGVIDSAMLPLALLGLALLQTNIVVSLKMIFIIILTFILNPLASHMIAKANLISK